MADYAEMEAGASSSGSSSIGDAVSGRGVNMLNEDEDLYYIPERRPSLDLGQSPMDINHWHLVGPARSPALSYGSMTSEENTRMDDEDETFTRVQLNTSDSFSSCYSLDSNDCEERSIQGKIKEETASELFHPESIQDPDEPIHPSLTVAFALKAICNILGKLSDGDIRMFKTLLWRRYPRSFTTPPEQTDILEITDRLIECYGVSVSLEITKTLLQEMGLKRMVDYLKTLCIRNEVRHDLSENLKRTYGGVCEESAAPGEERLLDDVFTDLYITSTCDNGPNIEHEVMTIDKLDTNQEAGNRLFTGDFLSPASLERSNIRLLLLIGVAGSGKSTAVRQLVLDWIGGRSHQHVSFLFPLTFRQLKQFEASNISLLEIIQTLYPETKRLRDEDYRSNDCRIMFVFDGLDEYGGALDFQNTELLGDIADRTTLNIIVVNLLRERLLYRGLFVVTSRPQVRRYVPWDTPYEEVDLRGFCEPEKDRYFEQSFPDPDQAAQVVGLINASQTLRIMCHLPLFCRLLADECRCVFKEHSRLETLPHGITYIYTKLLLALARQRRRFRAPDLSSSEEQDFLMALGKLAFNMLERGQFKISKSDWKEFGISDVEAVINSGLCTQFLTTPFVLSQDKVLSFLHPTLQEYLAALYVFLSFRNGGKNVFEQQTKQKLLVKLKGSRLVDLYKSAVDRSLQSEDGRLDMFLRFLFGMASETNLELLQPLGASPVKWPTFSGDAAALIRKRMRGNLHPGRSRNLQRCLEELQPS